jgi:putative oxidoreductase
MLSLLWFAGILECFGGLLIVRGLFTRQVAFILCGEMAVAYFKQHATRGIWPITNGGELAVILLLRLPVSLFRWSGSVES